MSLWLSLSATHLQKHQGSVNPRAPASALGTVRTSAPLGQPCDVTGGESSQFGGLSDPLLTIFVLFTVCVMD